MQPPLLLEPEARSDLAEAFLWYDNQQLGLGSEFLTEVALVLERSEHCLNPTQSSVAKRAERLVRGCPTPCFDVLDPEVIAVTAVMHGRRDPHQWPER